MDRKIIAVASLVDCVAVCPANVWFDGILEATVSNR